MNIRRNLLSNYQGFTLVELLVTITIIGVLAMISVAVFQQYKVSAYRAEIVQIARNVIGSSYVVQADQNGDFHGAISFNGRSAMVNLPGVGHIPEHIGGYARPFTHQSNLAISDETKGAISIRICSLKVIEDGFAATYRFRRWPYHGGDRDYQGFVTNTADGLWTENDCQNYAL